MKKEIKKKKWYKNRQLKRMRQLSRRKRHHYSVPNKEHRLIRRVNPHIVVAPDNFSLVNNAVEVVEFFSRVFSVIYECEKNDRLFFDLSKIKRATVDAIMYFIAIINNVKRLRAFSINCSGNMPKELSARDLFQKVGFYNYVNKTSFLKETRDPERIKIIQGGEINGELASTICDFVNEKMGSNSIIATKRLYPMLIELMANVTQHAYRDKSGKMLPKWYIYVENRDEDIVFVFLDTGAGIPNTIRKNWAERILKLFGGDRDDATYIEASLKGEFRTETKQDHRGKGLPEIYNAVKNKKNRMYELFIISGSGKCRISHDNIIEKEYINGSFDGSMFVWNFRKG